MIYLAADHAGFELKKQVKKYLEELGEQFKDLGTDSSDSVDYPDFAKLAAQKIQADHSPAGETKAILLCGSGQGICIAANKFKGVRAAQAWNAATAKAGRNDDDINGLCLAARHQTISEVKPIIKAFLETPFDNAKRRIRRLKKINNFEI